MRMGGMGMGGMGMMGGGMSPVDLLSELAVFQATLANLVRRSLTSRYRYGHDGHGRNGAGS